MPSFGDLPAPKSPRRHKGNSSEVRTDCKPRATKCHFRDLKKDSQEGSCTKIRVDRSQQAGHPLFHGASIPALIGS